MAVQYGYEWTSGYVFEWVLEAVAIILYHLIDLESNNMIPQDDSLI